MKKFITLFIITLLFSFSLFGQSKENGTNNNNNDFVACNLFYDAKEINKYLKNGSATNIAKIIAEYKIDSKSIKKNKFLDEFNDKFDTCGISFNPSVTTTEKTSFNISSSLGGLNVTTLADGFAKFIVKRSKQELSIAFFDRFKIELDSNKDLRTLFPQTHRNLSIIGEEIYMFEPYIHTLRETFENDLSNLPTNLPEILNNHEKYLNNHKKLKSILQSGFYFTKKIQEKTHPGILIENYPDSFFINLDSNVVTSIKILKLFSTSLKSNKNGNNYWISSNEIKELLSDTTLFKIFLGLIAQKASISEPSLFKSINDSYDNSKYINIYKSFIKELFSKANSLDIGVKELNKINNDSLLFEKYHAVISKTIDLIKYSTKVETLPNFSENSNLLEISIKYFDVITILADVGVNVNRRKYSSAIVNIAYLFDKILEKNEISKKIIKYGSFMALMTEAKTSDEVAAAIEAFALPTGSSRIKRESKFNISLNAYCGLFTGYEKIKNIDDKFCFNSFGVSAPIGISISRGHSIFFIGTGNYGWKNNKCGWSSSIFLSIVDIGALAAFRFENDDTESVPNIELKDIISPGIFYSFGIPKTPLSINIGYQEGPLLRKVKKEENTYGEKYTRWSISFVVDIPIFNFYTKSKS